MESIIPANRNAIAICQKNPVPTPELSISNSKSFTRSMTSKSPPNAIVCPYSGENEKMSSGILRIIARAIYEKATALTKRDRPRNNPRAMPAAMNTSQKEMSPAILSGRKDVIDDVIVATANIVDSRSKINLGCFQYTIWISPVLLAFTKPFVTMEANYFLSDSPMRIRARAVFFWVLVMLCLVTIGAIALYSFGYRYNFTRGIFIYTGSVSIKSNPKDVSITVDGKSVDTQASTINNSYHITGLNPGPHLVMVSAPGYLPWSKEAIVTSGISTEFWNVLLTRETYPEKTYPTSTFIQKIYPSPKSNLLAYVTMDGAETTVHTFDTKTDQDIQIFSSRDRTIDTLAHENLEWSPRADALIIPTLTATHQKDYSIVYTDTLETTDLKDIAGTDSLESVRWNPDARDTILYLSQHDLWLQSTKNTTEKSLLSDHVAHYDLSGTNTIYLLDDPNDLVWKFTINNPSDRTQITTSSPEITQGSDGYSLIVYDQDRFFLIDYATGVLYLYNNSTESTSFEKLSDQALGAQFSNDGKKLLYWTNWEIAVRFTRAWEVQPARSENQDMEIARFSQKLQHVQWTRDYEHVLVSTSDTQSIIELDHRDRASTDLRLTAISTEPALQIVPDFGSNLLYFIRSDDAEHPENHTLSSITFPEPTVLFGLINQ